jgi:hypothetical protein
VESGNIGRIPRIDVWGSGHQIVNNNILNKTTIKHNQAQKME